jgi:hypothetical protein
MNSTYNTIEVWKDISGFEGLYQVSNLGRVKSCERIVKQRYGTRRVNDKILSLGHDKDGYFMAILCKLGTKKTVKVHRLVADAFLEKLEYKNIVNHIDSNKSNNFFLNLEWTSSLENNCHKSLNSKTTSNYVGVYFYPRENKYRSKISINGKYINLGAFKTEEEAYLKRVEYEKENNIENKYLQKK